MLTLFIIYSVINILVFKYSLKSAVERTRIITMLEIFNKTDSRIGMDDLNNKYVFFYNDEDEVKSDKMSVEILKYVKDSEKTIFNKKALLKILKDEEKRGLQISVFNLFGDKVVDLELTD